MNQKYLQFQTRLNLISCMKLRHIKVLILMKKRPYIYFKYNRSNNREYFSTIAYLTWISVISYQRFLTP